MHDVVSNNERLVKENLFAFGVGDAVVAPILISIPVVPLEPNTSVQFVVNSHQNSILP